MNAHLLLAFDAFNPIRLSRRETFSSFDEVIAFSKTDKMGEAQLSVCVTGGDGFQREVFVGTCYPGGHIRYTNQWLAWKAAVDLVGAPS